MLERYIAIENHIPSIDFQQFGDLLLTDTDLDDIKELCKTFVEPDSVTIALQDRSTTVAKALTFFDVFIDEHASTRTLLGHRAEIVENPNFKSAIIKVQNNIEAMLIGAEKLTLRTIQDKNQTTNQKKSKKWKR